MFFKKSLFLVFTVLVFCESAFVDNFQPCNINDGECAKNQLQTILKKIAKTGVPELEIPQIDPMKVEDISLSVLDLLDISLYEGTLRGVKDCVVDKFSPRLEKGRATVELTCDVSLKGHYKVFSASPIVKTLFGADTVHGDGNGKVKIEKLHLKFEFSFFVQRRNGELYFKCKPDKTTYKYEIKGKTSFVADSLFIGDKESSKIVTDLLNQNGQFLLTSFGKPFMDKAMEYVYNFIHVFLDNVPAKYFVAGDLSSYAKDE